MKEFEIEIPKEVEVKIDGNFITVKGKLGELKEDFDLHLVKHKNTDGKLVISVESERNKNKAVGGAVAAHVRNMIKGVTVGYEYRMKMVYAHFPINISVDGDRFVIKNFVGEKTPRYAHIIKNVKVEIKGQDVTVSGIRREDVGQTAANIESATKIKRKDTRIFQDGIYITHKGD